MNLFEIDYFKGVLNLVKEAFTFKKYKAMHPVLAVLTGLFMIPFVVNSLLNTALLLVLTALLKVVKAPIDYLKDLTSSQGEKVHPATQFIIYFFSWPLIFVLYAVNALFVLVINILYASTSFNYYVWTLGGFKFHLLVKEQEDFVIEVNNNYSKGLIITFICVALAIFVVAPVIEGVITYIVLYMNWMEQNFNFVLIYGKYLFIGIVFTMLYSLIGLAPRPIKEIKVEENK